MGVGVGVEVSNKHCLLFLSCVFWGVVGYKHCLSFLTFIDIFIDFVKLILKRFIFSFITKTRLFKYIEIFTTKN